MNTINKNMKTSFNQNLIYLLGNAFCDQNAFDFIDFKLSHYEEAKAELEIEINKDEIYNETIYLRMLQNGHPILLSVAEEDDHIERLTYNKLIKGLNLYIERHEIGVRARSLQEIIDKGDFWDNEAVLQYAVFGDVIIG